MSLPIRLGVGMLSIYGQGSINGMFQLEQNPANPVKFGIVDSAYNIYGSVSPGQSVLYRPQDAIPIFYNAENLEYYLIPESKIIATEIPIIIPPAP